MKKRKPNAKERELKSQWDKMVALHARPLEKGAKAKAVKATSILSHKPNVFIPEDRNPRHIASVDSGKGNAVKKEAVQYTGDAMLGLATLHKSNTVPIFNTEAAKDVTKMRR